MLLISRTHMLVIPSATRNLLFDCCSKLRVAPKAKGKLRLQI